MSRRLFVAVPMPPDIRAAASAWVAAHDRWPVRWIAESDLHVTLVPPWYELLPDRAAEALRLVAGSGAVDLAFDRVGLGPSPRDPRLIWAEGEAPVPLLDLKVRIERSLGTRTTLREPFRLHVTLARFRPGDLPKFPSRRLEERVDWRGRAETVVLFESHLDPAGARYDIVEEIRLSP